MLRIKCSTPHGGEAEILLFTEETAEHNILDTLSWFNMLYVHMVIKAIRFIPLRWVFPEMNRYVFFKSKSKTKNLVQNPIHIQTPNLCKSNFLSVSFG